MNLRPQSKPYIYIYSQKDVFKSVFTLIKNGSTNLWIKIYSTELCLSLDWFQKLYNIYLSVVKYFIAWVWLDVHKSIPKKLVSTITFWRVVHNWRWRTHDGSSSICSWYHFVFFFLIQVLYIRLATCCLLFACYRVSFYDCNLKINKF